MISLILPMMRKEQGIQVLKDLNEQSYKPDGVLVVNNGCLDISSEDLGLDYELKIFEPGKNIGTNAAWNLMWHPLFSKADYIGMIGDDYRLNPYNITRMHYVLEGGEVGVTCAILQSQYPPRREVDGMRIPMAPCRGKGHMGFALFSRKWLLENVPPIPEVFKIFFGDNWIGWHIDKAGKSFMCLTDTIITHYHHEDLSEGLEYKEVIEEERVHWKAYIRGEIQL